MHKYRKRPFIIEAVQFSGADLDLLDTPKWFIDAVMTGIFKYGGGLEDPYLLIPTRTGNIRVDTGCWVIRGVCGEYDTCAPDLFEKAYEPVEAEDAPIEVAN